MNIEKLKEIAKRKVRTDDDEFNPQDWSGGNFDDAYSMGVEDGETLLAVEVLRDILKEDV